MIVQTADDIIKVVGDKALQKAKLVNAFVLAPVYLSEPIYVLALSPVKNGETADTVSNWFFFRIFMLLRKGKITLVS